MPAKTVVFTNVRKFDGDKFRWISSGEYIQMSGRTGRRGIDTHGICILMVDERMEPFIAKMMLKGNADSLNSAFHLKHLEPTSLHVPSSMEQNRRPIYNKQTTAPWPL